MNNEIIIVKLKYGSHLYGTNTPDSDLDYKGIFLPSKKQILLNRIPKSYSETTKKGNTKKNTASDVDTEIYSLHYFIELACQGQTVALDMLHAPDNMIVEKNTNIWDDIVSNKEKFYTRNLKAFVGYARRQAAKYGIKGSRLNAAKDVLDFLHSVKDKTFKLYQVWDELPSGEHIHKYTQENNMRIYQVVGKAFQETVRVEYVIPILEKFYEEYGERARKAALNEDIDFKAVSHALRAAYQTKQILVKKNITFPLKKADFLTNVKLGKVDYTTVIVPTLEELMNEVEELSEKSDLPLKVDRRFWDNFLIKTMEERIRE